MRDAQFLAEQFEANRAHLQAVAYRMLGSRAEAEDAVQEAWLRLCRGTPDSLENLTGWLTTVVGRVCLDQLRTRKRRREEPIGAEAEALPADADPERDIAMADAIGTAMLAVLDMLSPQERVAFILHDMFNLSFEDISGIIDRSSEAARQLASRARRRVRGQAGHSEAHRLRNREIVDAFLTASRGGDLSGLLAILDPDIVLRADAAAIAASAARADQGAPAFRTPTLHGREPIAKLFLGRAQGAQPAWVDGGPGLVVPIGGQPIAVFRFKTKNGVIAEIDVTCNVQTIEAMKLEY
ncbi:MULTISPECIES: sigma-70 family RNA polymerase sigma factor [Bradyrhizobium]|uniref:sigma-70 family RNA polymerase sigma factor n=1 Tax=Bradyrhizobium TaxID=374 RepID=UPI0004AD22AB|nr:MULTISPECIES: sigma-70 family RNA polymerase sigma factor [Bradyrhizobium]MBR0948361.1 sigma-70 family RNA polymerase sigma factor [Bradyrhizobium liaoningense]MDI2077336.1 sigma-70 family RNA polymerase sigma factor [Bradyrhizobium sp. Mp27]